jgi:hypothetical protein
MDSLVCDNFRGLVNNTKESPFGFLFQIEIQEETFNTLISSNQKEGINISNGLLTKYTIDDTD